MLLSQRKKKGDKKLVNLLKKHCELEDDLLQLFKKSEEQQIDIDQIINRVNLLRNLRNESLKFLNIQEKEDIYIEEKILVRERDLDKELIDSYHSAKNEIVSVYENISDIPVLDLDIIKSFIIQFSKLIKEVVDIPKIDIDSNIVLSKTKTTGEFKTILNNGKKVIITSKNHNFESFNQDELLEILRFFDVCILDTSYDHIRTQIVKRINNIS
jgi:hypothetical protein